MDAKGREISGVPGITFFHFSKVVVCVLVVLVVVVYVYVDVDVAVDRVVVGVYFGNLRTYVSQNTLNETSRFRKFKENHEPRKKKAK